MNFIKSYRKRFVVFLAVCLTVMIVTYIRSIVVIPGEITLLDDDDFVYDLRTPFLVNIKADRDGIVELGNKDVKASSSYLKLSNPLSLKPRKNGSVSLNVKLFGVIPLKTLKVDVVANRQLVACGNTVGVKLRIDGILVIGVSDVETLDGKKVLPTLDAGIRPGDLLTEINGSEVEGIDNLIQEIDKSKGNAVKLKYRRGKVQNEVEVKPVISIDDKKYHLGLWVRDNTAGIGTLTFYDPDSRYFGALGHGITDIDTGTLMPIDKGEILESNILGIKKGRYGIPGELKGVFIEDKNKLGVIKTNSDCGIYGILNDDSLERISKKAYPIGLRSQIKEGPAVILSNVEGRTVEAYDVEIQKVSKQNLNGSKGMIIKITDSRLLEATGGIVQGMSGSPIIQNGKIIGAVTHVLVNDPTRGYGIFIESMLNKLNDRNMAGLGIAG